ncbi:MAG: hypothetical protein FJ020_09260 [Chloroflexi bacterium]|nr:hypothetical protein [Chloroflexota bacterium]
MRRNPSDYIDLIVEGLVGAVVAYFLIGAVFSEAEDKWFWITVLSLIEVGAAALFVRSLLSK